MSRCVVISRGFCYGMAMEIALKLKELTYVTAEPYSSADFQHGPMAIIEPGSRSFSIAPSGTLHRPHGEFAEGLQEREAEIIAISDVAEILRRGTTALPDQHRALRNGFLPCLRCFPGSLFALNLALAKGIRSGRPARASQGDRHPIAERVAEAMP